MKTYNSTTYNTPFGWNSVTDGARFYMRDTFCYFRHWWTLDGLFEFQLTFGHEVLESARFDVGFDRTRRIKLFPVKTSLGWILGARPVRSCAIQPNVFVLGPSGGSSAHNKLHSRGCQKRIRVEGLTKPLPGYGVFMKCPPKSKPNRDEVRLYTDWTITVPDRRIVFFPLFCGIRAHMIKADRSLSFTFFTKKIKATRWERLTLPEFVDDDVDYQKACDADSVSFEGGPVRYDAFERAASEACKKLF